MPLQKITLFRKTVDGDGTTPTSRNVGIGIDCETDSYTGHVVIINVYSGGAAHNSGQVFPSDTLLQVNGTSVTGMPTQQVLQMLAGEAGTPVSILVSHNPQNMMAAPMVLPVPPTETKSEVVKVDHGPTLEEQEAEERRLAREKVRQIFDGMWPRCLFSSSLCESSPSVDLLLWCGRAGAGSTQDEWRCPDPSKGKQRCGECSAAIRAPGSSVRYKGGEAKPARCCQHV